MSEPKNLPIFIGGLKNAGKTTLIQTLIRIGRKKKIPCAGFKPFDVGHLKMNAEERVSDGELFCGIMEGLPAETLVSPYLAHEDYPVEMAFRRDGIRIDWEHIQQRLRILEQYYKKTFIELPPGMFMPLNESKNLLEWIKGFEGSMIWVMGTQKEDFEHNLAQLNAIMESGLEFEILFNIAKKTLDQDLLFYIWEKTEEFTDRQAQGMIGHIANPTNRIEILAEKTQKDCPSLIEKLF